VREATWALVVPVKRLAVAKTRLRSTSVGVPHDRLVLALAQDTVRAALACPLVTELLVVTDDPVATAALARLGARVVPDKPDAGLNAAISYGAGLIDPTRWVAALTADLPALRPAELAAALRAAAAADRRRGFVPDAAGTGTTLLATPPGVPLDPRFGPGSAERHLASQARDLTHRAGDPAAHVRDTAITPNHHGAQPASEAPQDGGPWPSLRRDVDTGADLAAAERLGLGPDTSALWHAKTA
jgi:2-phospho-L-lactate/phosphoenolpyruvate guanylyltransferase